MEPEENWESEAWRMGSGGIEDRNLDFAERRMVMRLHILRGSFATGTAAANNLEGGGSR